MTASASSRARVARIWLPALPMVLVCAAFCWPVLHCIVVPSMDLPAHLALVEAARHLGEPAHILSQRFAWGTLLAPNTMLYAVVYLLAPWMGVEVAGRAIVLVYLLAAPVSCWRFAVAFGRSRWAALLASSVLVQAPLVEGFIDYCLSVPLLLCALAAARETVARPTPRSVGLVVLIQAGVFFAHVQASWIYVMSSLGLVGLAVVDRRRRRMRGGAMRWATLSIALVGPTLLLVCAWLLAAGAPLRSELSSGWSMGQGFVARLGALPAATVAITTYMGSWLAIAPVLVGWGAAAAMVRTRRVPLTVARVRPSVLVDRWFPLLFAALLLVGYFGAPASVGHYALLHLRFVLPLTFVVAVITFPAGVEIARGRRSSWLLVPALVACLGTLVPWWKASSQLDRFAAGFREVLASAPSGSSLAYLPEDMRETGFVTGIGRHWGQYHTVFNGGVTSFSFGVHPGRAIVQKAPGFDFEYADVPLAMRVIASRRYEVILQRGPTRLEVMAPGAVQVVRRRGAWTLYRVTERADSGVR